MLHSPMQLTSKRGSSVCMCTPYPAQQGQSKTCLRVSPARLVKVPRAFSEYTAHLKEVKNNVQGKTTAAVKHHPSNQHSTTQGKQEPSEPTRQMTWFVLFMLIVPQLLAHYSPILLCTGLPAVFHSRGSALFRGG